MKIFLKCNHELREFMSFRGEETSASQISKLAGKHLKKSYQLDIECKNNRNELIVNLDKYQLDCMVSSLYYTIAKAGMYSPGCVIIDLDKLINVKNIEEDVHYAYHE